LVHRTAKISYGQFVRKWHEGNEDLAAPVDAAGRPFLILHAINANERVSLHPTSDSGTFSALDLDRASSALRDTRSGNRHPMEPRLLDVLYRAQVHFGAPEIRVVSGYRTAHGKPSNHSRGRAVDFVVPGVSDADVARFARDLGFVGVGIYPASGFVHVDVRHRSYFWVDASGPGRRNRERGILGDLAKRSDAAALARGARGLHPFFFSTDVDSALRSKGLFAAVEGHGPDDDDDDDDDE
jgi:uncharacterized protein YcbK (DUF882 family)